MGEGGENCQRALIYCLDVLKSVRTGMQEPHIVGDRRLIYI